jgi:hypothetical protein
MLLKHTITYEKGEKGDFYPVIMTREGHASFPAT